MIVLLALLHVALAEPDAEDRTDDDPWRALLEEAARGGEPIDLGDSPDERLEEARERIRQGDHLGARVVLSQVLDRDGDHLEEATYLTGVAFEREGQLVRAVERYREVLSRWPRGARTDDARFRIAETHLAGGRPRDALRALRPLRPYDDRPFLDHLKLALTEGTTQLRLGRSRRGGRTLGRALDLVTGPELAWYEARARAAIASALVAESTALHLRTSESRQRERLEHRARLIRAAEKQIVAAALLKEPEWVLQGLLDLGHAYEQLGEALLEARPPRSLDDVARGSWQDEIDQKVVVLRVKAAKHYQKGLEVADRLGWESRRVRLLEEALREVEAKVEG